LARETSIVPHNVPRLSPELYDTSKSMFCEANTVHNLSDSEQILFEKVYSGKLEVAADLMIRHDIMMVH
jgi:hypothetical protein